MESRAAPRTRRAVHRAGAHRIADREVSVHGRRRAAHRRPHRRHRAVLLLRSIHGRRDEPHLHRIARQRHGGRRIERPYDGSVATMKAPSLTIGIEEEYQIINPETRELRSYITEILKEDDYILREVKPELH